MEQLRRIATLLSNPRTPGLPKVAVALAVLYMISPVDILPDVMPVIGWMDDLTFVWMAFRWLLNSGGAALPVRVDTPGPPHLDTSGPQRLV